MKKISLRNLVIKCELFIPSFIALASILGAILSLVVLYLIDPVVYSWVFVFIIGSIILCGYWAYSHISHLYREYKRKKRLEDWRNKVSLPEEDI